MDSPQIAAVLSGVEHEAARQSLGERLEVRLVQSLPGVLIPVHLKRIQIVTQWSWEHHGVLKSQNVLDITSWIFKYCVN